MGSSHTSSSAHCTAVASGLVTTLCICMDCWFRLRQEPGSTMPSAVAPCVLPLLLLLFDTIRYTLLFADACGAAAEAAGLLYHEAAGLLHHEAAGLLHHQTAGLLHHEAAGRPAIPAIRRACFVHLHACLPAWRRTPTSRCSCCRLVAAAAGVAHSKTLPLLSGLNRALSR